MSYPLSLLLEASFPAPVPHGPALLLCLPAEYFLSFQTDNHPGNCWPFPGSQGHVFIKLSVLVIPRAVTMAHVSGTAFHGESISGAPKDFAVYVSDFSGVGGRRLHSIAKQGVKMGQRFWWPEASSCLSEQTGSLELLPSHCIPLLFNVPLKKKKISWGKMLLQEPQGKGAGQCVVLNHLVFQSQWHL